jgi:NAD(P)H-hydrate epimerase
MWHGELIVDGLLGTGVRGSVEGLLRHLIERVNATDTPVCALDVPSGLDCDDGQPCGTAVEATWTTTFAHPKRGMLTPSGARHCGRVEVIDIGINAELSRRQAEQAAGAVAALAATEVRQLLPVRALVDHKNRFGHVLVIAGSRGMTGAATLTAGAALRAGAGLVTMAVPASLLPLVAPVCPACMTLPVADEGKGCFTAAAAADLQARWARFDAVALGPGLGRMEATRAFVAAVLETAECPLVIDADALNNMADDAQLLGKLPAQAVLTPHPGEFARLTGEKPGASAHERVQAAQGCAEKYNCTVVLKGFQTVVAAPGCMPHINLTGNPGLATAGAGDVLTGVIASLAAQGLTEVDAARAGTYLHGLAADIVAGQGSRGGVTAPDVIDALSLAIRHVQLL